MLYSVVALLWAPLEPTHHHMRAEVLQTPGGSQDGRSECCFHLTGSPEDIGSALCHLKREGSRKERRRQTETEIKTGSECETEPEPQRDNSGNQNDRCKPKCLLTHQSALFGPCTDIEKKKSWSTAPQQETKLELTVGKSTIMNPHWGPYRWNTMSVSLPLCRWIITSQGGMQINR